MLLPSATAATLVLLFSAQISAVPQPTGVAGLTVPLKRRSPSSRTDKEWGNWAQAHKVGLEAKYGARNIAARGAGLNLYGSLFSF